MKTILAQAEDGSLRSIAVACIYRDDLTPDANMDTGWSRTPGTRFALGYAIQQLQHRWCAAMDDPKTP